MARRFDKKIAAMPTSNIILRKTRDRTTHLGLKDYVGEFKICPTPPPNRPRVNGRAGELRSPSIRTTESSNPRLIAQVPAIQKSMIAKCRWRLKSRRHKQNRPSPVKASIESTKVDFACIAAVSTAKLEC
jgi:hypothetical protein